MTLACCAGPAVAAQKPIVKLLSVPIAMRDGVRLSANVFLASERARVPAILVRTPYGKGADITPNYQAFVEHGYAIVVEDVRGSRLTIFCPSKLAPAVTSYCTAKSAASGPKVCSI